jgi:RNA polymerase sigma-70 factor (ECF subfamily)
MPTEGSFADIMARLRAGDPDAAAAVFHRFAGRLIALARKRLDGRLRQKVDPEDVLQSVYKSFFLRHAGGQFDLRDWDGLWALLTVITVRKCGRWADHFRAGIRDVGREKPPPAAGDADRSWEVLAREPSPSEAAVLAETVEDLIRGLPERDRAIVTLGLQGYTGVEISEELGRPERTVYRVLGRVRKQLQRQRDESARPSGSAPGLTDRA